MGSGKEGILRFSMIMGVKIVGKNRRFHKAKVLNASAHNVRENVNCPRSQKMSQSKISAGTIDPNLPIGCCHLYMLV